MESSQCLLPTSLVKKNLTWYWWFSFDPPYVDFSMFIVVLGWIYYL